jgi:hypothetical protein
VVDGAVSDASENPLGQSVPEVMDFQARALLTSSVHHMAVAVSMGIFVKLTDEPELLEAELLKRELIPGGLPLGTRLGVAPPSWVNASKANDQQVPSK